MISFRLHRTMIIFGLGALLLGLVIAGGLILAMGEVPQLSYEQLCEFTLKDTVGEEHNLADYAGKVVFLNFWASWQTPCQEELPSIQKVYDDLDKDKFVMLTINSGQKKGEVKSFLAENGYTFPVLLDKEAKIVRKYGIRNIPTTLIIGRDGKIVSKISGPRDWTMRDIEFLVD